MSDPTSQSGTQPVRAKLTKWAMFTVGLVLTASASDIIAFIANQETVSLGRLFGRGELFMVSIGLLVAASADLVFDRLVRGGGRLYHGVVLAFCLLTMVPVAVAYGAAKGEGVNYQSVSSGTARVQSDDKIAHRAEFSLYILLLSSALSGVGVYLSEKGGVRAGS